MSKVLVPLISTFTVLALCAAPPVAHAADTAISAKKLIIKDNADAAKRQLQVLSSDAAVLYADAGAPGDNGASVHAYSATDDYCLELPPGADWKDNGKKWKYNDMEAKTSLQISNGKLQVKIKSGMTFTIADDFPQDSVDVVVRMGTTTRYCMQCSTAIRDDAKVFIAKDCVAGACGVEPSLCDPPAPHVPVVLLGALNATSGRFNYNATIGLSGSDAACNGHFPGTHTCTYAELQDAAAAGDLAGLTSTPGNQTVTSFWAIDSAEPDNLQCATTIPWDYATQHTGHFAEKVSLDNGTGTLVALMVGQPDGALCSGSSWVGCCQ